MTIKLPTSVAELRPIERRVLSYLDQRGPSHRERVVFDLASPESRIGKRGGIRGSNGATPLIFGSWARRLLKAGLIRKEETTFRWRTKRGGERVSWSYRHHEITPAGRKLLRSEA